MKDKTATCVARGQLDAQLAHASGSDEVYEHWTGRVYFTTGAKCMADTAGGYWLLDAIASHINHTAAASMRRAPFQVWTLRPWGVGQGALLVMREDSPPAPIRVRQEIEYTDFPLYDAEGHPAPFKLYAVSNGPTIPPTILLPSEY